MKFSGKKQPRFPAILKTQEGKLIEYGMASVSEEDRSVDFRSEFVPIFEMGVPLKIVRVQAQLETQSFMGEVYLSSQRLLRLVSVTDQVLPGAQSAFAYDVQLQGTMTIQVDPPAQPSRRFPLLHRHPTGPGARVVPVSIYAISLSQVRFTCNVVFSQGQRISLDINQPLGLEGLPLEVDKPVTLGPTGTCSYHGRILALTGVNASRLEPYVERLSLMKYKMFPPAVTPPAGASDV